MSLLQSFSRRLSRLSQWWPWAGPGLARTWWVGVFHLRGFCCSIKYPSLMPCGFRGRCARWLEGPMPDAVAAT